ncbi:hypothetical protein OAB57_02355 [Bacteriovoracaceae bacterium]|nr:hypothetical protein [Bacteriovoracaceae bacterium]
MRCIFFIFLISLLIQSSYSVIPTSELTIYGDDILSSGDSKIEKEEIENHTASLPSLLEETGIAHIVSSGQRGQVATIKLDNGQSGTILLNGMTVQDPSELSGNVDLSLIDWEEINSIVLDERLPAILYGNRGLGGAIKLSSEHLEGGKVSLTLGNRSLIEPFLSYRGGNRYRYGLSVSHFETRGVSAANKIGGDKDGHSANTINADVGYFKNDRNNVTISGRVLETTTDLDRSGGEFGDDPNYEAKQRKQMYQLKSTIVGGHLNFAHTITDRDYNNDPDPSSEDFRFGNYRGFFSETKGDYTFFFGDNVSFVPGFDLNFSKADFDERSNWGHSTFSEQQNTIAVYSVLSWDSELLSLSIGSRGTNSQNWGTHGDIGLYAKILSPSKSYSTTIDYETGIQAPTLYQLFEPQYGNRELRPSETKMLQVRIARIFTEKGTVGIKGSVGRTKNRIDFQNAKYVNGGKNDVVSGGIFFNYDITDRFNFATKYSYINSVDQVTKLSTLRLPKDTGQASIKWIFTDTFHVKLTGKYTGKRIDIHPISYNRVEMPSYAVMNVHGTKVLDKNIQLSFGIINIANKKHESIAGYTGTPLGIRGKLSWKW